jgi:hypothetical protein
MRIGHIALTLPLLFVALAPVAACDMDPVHASLVSQLGPEAAGIPTGEFHRAGQPCVVCHGDQGPVSSKFSIAGTVFYGPNTSMNSPGFIGASGTMNQPVTVYLEDDNQTKFQVNTNCVGNFWIRPQDWQPSFPVIVSIGGPTLAGGTTTQKMNSHIGREPSCGMCHQVQSYPSQPGAIANYYSTPGVIYLTGDDPNYKGDPSCPVQPPSPVGLAPVSQ